MEPVSSRQMRIRRKYVSITAELPLATRTFSLANTNVLFTTKIYFEVKTNPEHNVSPVIIARS